jgi:hypothetical protein
MTAPPIPKETIHRILAISNFLLWMEKEKSRDYVMGGYRLGAVIDAWCKMTGISLMELETIVFADQKITNPRKEAS